MKREYYYPIEVRPLEDYRILLTFNNKERRVFNVKPYLDDVFWAPLRNPAIFHAVRINPMTVEWPGEIEFAPDVLYEDSEPVTL